MSLFLPNGGRLYFDDEAQEPGCGLVEWATPECRTVVEAVLYDLAGERMLAEAIPDVEQELSGRVTFLKNNTDPAGHCYGCHENYSVARSSELLPDEPSYFQFLVRILAPFLITRQIFCGAGRAGAYRHANNGETGYQLSQRADFLSGVISEDARRYRPLINTRDEAHADPRRYRRLHILAGDSNISAWCTFMKLGTTHLVLQAAEDLAFDADLVICNPMLALRTISYNGCEAEVAVREGGRETSLTALAIQKRYLEAVEGCFEFPPDVATSLILREWRAALKSLAANPLDLSDRVDWVTKLAMLTEERMSSGAAWDSPSITEIDLRYHDIDPRRGIFPQLLRDQTVYYGPLAEALGDAQVERAVTTPPSDTRARLRGEYVSWCWKQGLDAHADWTEITLDGNHIILNDPLVYSPEALRGFFGSGARGGG
jgi:proteasome accessory factor A